MLEHQGERADADVFHVIAQQARIGVRNDQADDQNGEDIEQQNTPEHLTHRARDVFTRVLRFAGRDADKLGALEREADDHRHANHRREAAGERRVPYRPVLPAGVLAAFRMPTIISTPTAMKIITVLTLISANQYSASPNPFTEM